MGEQLSKVKKYNLFCVIGFICSVFSCIIGFVLSILGLVKVKKTGEAGKGLAISGIVLVVVKVLIFFDPFHFFYFPSINPNLTLNTACSLVNEEGNYETDGPDSDGKMVCKDYVCVVTYEGKSYKKKCK